MGDKTELIDRVIAQIKKDVYEDYFTAIQILLDSLTAEELKLYLPEEE